MIQLELLAPARDLSCGMAAIDHGADAVYIGPPHFGARVAAGNSVDDVASLCQYAHRYGAKVYVTVNTLIYEREEEEVKLLLQQLANIHVDAILVQDMKLLSLSAGLPMVLHASTQADNRTAEQVEWLWHHGFSRAVLARELSALEIEAVHRQVPQMELEVFVHGALCVSYSGLCYASEHCFHRSANRGECAQFCRMQFDLLDADWNELIHKRHLLSLKDLNLSAYLGRLIESGATSFKIEGRLKDIAYVKNVTAAYSQLLNNYIAVHPGQYERSSQGHCRYLFQPDLSRTFNRGYTSYFVEGRQPAMASFFTPKSIGQYVGKVKELRSQSFTVAGTVSFTNGDGLCFFNAHRELVGFRVNRVEGNHLYPQSMPQGLVPGAALYRSSDQAMERALSKPSAERRIAVTMRLEAFGTEDTDTGFILTVDDGKRSVVARLKAAHQLARTPQISYIQKELSKLGNTLYTCSQVEIAADFPYFIPASSLASLRRMGIEELEAKTVSENVKAISSVNKVRSDTKTVEAKDMKQGNFPLMQCRYCLRHEMGFCVKKGGKLPTWREPLYLRLGDGRRFRLEFDCRRCQMNVWPNLD